MNMWNLFTALFLFCTVSAPPAEVRGDEPAPPENAAPSDAGAVRPGQQEKPAAPKPDDEGAPGLGPEIHESGNPPPARMDYSGDWGHRPALTGDWDGGRGKLLEHGVKIDALFLPILQGNLSGGLRQEAMTYGSLRYSVELDTGAAGLWRGGSIVVKFQTACGRSANDQTGNAMINKVNWAAVDAGDGKSITTVTDALLFQQLNWLFSVAGGRITSRDSNVFASDDTTQFLNAAFNNNPAYNTTFPRQALFASLLVHPVRWFSLIGTLLDAGPPASDKGGTRFNRGVTLFSTMAFSVSLGRLPGHHRFAGTWSNKIKPTLESLVRQDECSEVVSSDWGLNDDFDQYLWQDRDVAGRGIGVFGRFGLGNRVTNKTKAFCSFGVGGLGRDRVPAVGGTGSRAVPVPVRGGPGLPGAARARLWPVPDGALPHRPAERPRPGVALSRGE